MDEIITFWFPNDQFQKFWFDKSIDKILIEKYSTILKIKENSKINISELNEIEILEHILLFDQFSRNIYRNSNYKKNDQKALELAFHFLNNYNYTKVKFNYLIFYLMPLRHSNNISNYNIIIKILDEMKLILNKNDFKLFNKFYNTTLTKLKKL